VRQVVALIGIAWAAVNAVLGALFAANAFTAGTLRKEGILAQLALLFGGALILAFAVILAWQAWKLFQHRTAA
jgi:hypothetical protein